MRKALKALVLSTPFFFAPFVTEAKSFADIVNNDVVPFGNAVIGLLYALCFIFFLIGIVRYLMSHNAENRQQGRIFAIYGLGALSILFIVWGLVRFGIEILSSFTT